MKLEDCINIAKECGLSTLGEAYDNIDNHVLNLFVFDEVQSELQELRNEICQKYNLTIISDNINDILI